MSTDRALERRVAHTLANEAPLAGPDGLADAVLAVTRRRTPRPAWLTLISEAPVRFDDRQAFGSPIVRSAGIFVVSLLLAVLAVGTVVAGASLLPSPSPQPSPEPAGIANGWIAFAPNPNGDKTRIGEHRDIYLTGEGTATRRIIGSDGDGLSQGCPQFSPDGAMLAYGEGDESVPPVDGGRAKWPVSSRAVVVVRLAVDGTPSPPITRVSLPTGPGPLPCPEWSADGHHLAVFTGTELWVVDAISGATNPLPVEVAETRADGWATMGDFDWAPDGRSIAVAEDARIRSIPIDGAPATVLRVAGSWSLEHVADGQRIVYVVSDDGGDQIGSIDVETGRDRMLRTDAFGGLVASPDGTRLAYLCVRARTPPERGARAARVPVCGEHGFITVMDSDGSDVTQIRTTARATHRLVWSPDGRRLLMIGNGSLSSVGVPPDEPAESSYPSSGLDFEWMGVKYVSWQAVIR